MRPDPIQTVTAFCADLSKDHGKTAIRRWFTPETVWVNEGITITTSIDEAIAALEAVEKSVGIKDAYFDMLTIAADVNRVLTERLNRFERADGSEIGDAMFIGIFEIEDNRIVAWLDDFYVRNADQWTISVDRASIQVTTTLTKPIA